MKLTKEQKRAALTALENWLNTSGKRHIPLLPEWIWLAATEWKQDEIDVWCAKLKAHEKLERNARFENAKLLEAVDELTVMNKAKAEAIEEHAQSIFSNENAKLRKALDRLMWSARNVLGTPTSIIAMDTLRFDVDRIKAGSDQREANGDGDGT